MTATQKKGQQLKGNFHEEKNKDIRNVWRNSFALVSCNIVNFVFIANDKTLYEDIIPYF
jgi:hypothetical protein